MKELILSKEYFNILDTLECGQIFRFKPYKEGYLVYSLDRCAYIYNDESNAVIHCNKEDEDYFNEFFDLSTNYSLIYESALKEDVEILTTSAGLGKGIRILKQDVEEVLYSFIISQNNNIPRIKLIIERLCRGLGTEKEFYGEKYYTFPTSKKIAKASIEILKETGLGYRAPYIKALAEKIDSGFSVRSLKNLPTVDLRKELLKIYGIGPKVADCVLFFGYSKTDSFPVDTWIEKVYYENFQGKLKNREEISKFFIDKFKDYSGYYQQYLFYYKRSKESLKYEHN